MTILVLTVGNVGCGKSFLAGKLAKNGFAVVNMDSLITMISGGEYEYRSDLGEVYRDSEYVVIAEFVSRGISVVVDRTNMDLKRRQRYLEAAKFFGVRAVCCDFGPGDKRSLKRRLRDPRGKSEELWTSVHKKMKDAYEKPSLAEGFYKLYPISFLYDTNDALLRRLVADSK